MTNKDIEFYFDFSSPYAYLTSKWIDDLAARYDRRVQWKPIMLGVAFKQTGMAPLFHQPLRGDYSMRDFMRTARLAGLEAVITEPFPYLSLAASRGFYWVQDNVPEKSHDFARAVFDRYFEGGVTPTTPEEIETIAQSLNIDGQGVVGANEDPAYKQRLKDETQAALDKGVFGAPFIVVDGEPFWGNDRQGQIEHWLKTGGW